MTVDGYNFGGRVAIVTGDAITGEARRRADTAHYCTREARRRFIAQDSDASDATSYIGGETLTVGGSPSVSPS